MEFGDLDIGDVFRWKGSEWEKHKPHYARPNVPYPRARNTETYFPGNRDVSRIE